MAFRRHFRKPRSFLSRLKNRVKGIHEDEHRPLKGVHEYQYLPLKGNDIRLVQLLPGAFDDDIHVRIVHEELIVLDEDPNRKSPSKRDVEATLPEKWRAFQTPEGDWHYMKPNGLCTYEHPSGNGPSQPNYHNTNTAYESLSYAWGDLERNHTVHVQAESINESSDKHPGGILKVTKNLDTALRYLRYGAHRYRTLWIDAICINQDHDAERGDQLTRMPSIYKYAQRVVMWLGPASHDSELAFSTLDLLGQQLEISVDGWETQAPNAEHADWWDKDCTLPFSKAEWTALENLFERPFFDRLWVLQEMSLAGAGAIWQCSLQAVPWRRVRRAMVALSDRTNTPLVLSAKTTNKQIVAFGFDFHTLPDIIGLARSHVCSKPHDNLYGTMAVLSPRLRNLLEPSYEIRFEEAYQKVFLEQSRITKRLELLAECFIQDGFDAPSWVPDLRDVSYITMTPSQICQASGMSPASFEVVSSGILAVKGRICEKIIQVLPEARGEEDEPVVKKLNELFAMFSMESLYITGHSMLDVLIKMLSLGVTRERTPADYGILSMQGMRDAIMEFVREPEATRTARLPGLDAFRTPWREVLSIMSFFTTEGGYHGFGSCQVRAGDMVCIMLGVHTPLVLRPADTNRYRVVGWCYVFGMMDAEVLLGPLPQGWDVEMEYTGNRDRPRYRHHPTNQVQKEDPRLWMLSDEWQRIDQEIVGGDPFMLDFFQNSTTGEVINYDPRMTAEVLEERGVKLETIHLV